MWTQIRLLHMEQSDLVWVKSMLMVKISSIKQPLTTSCSIFIDWCKALSRQSWLLSAALFICLCSLIGNLYCKQYGPRSNSTTGSSLIRVHSACSIKKSNALTLKAPLTTAADDKFCYIFPSFRKKNKVWYFKSLMKYQTLFVIFEKAAKF